MKLRSIHPEVTVNPDLHPTPLKFEAVVGGRFEGEVPDAVGALLLQVGRPGEFERLDAPAPESVSSESNLEGSEAPKGDESVRADAGKAKGRK